MNKLTSCVITYDFSDRSEQLDRNTIKDWLVRDANGDYIVNKDQVAAYVNSLGYKYDTFGCTRTFTTYDGRQKTIKGGDYGWAIDQTTETEWLYNAILAGTTEVRQPAYAYSGLCRDTNDIGNTYVEIDLTNQRMVFYKDGQLLRKKGSSRISSIFSVFPANSESAEATNTTGSAFSMTFTQFWSHLGVSSI